jgi:hypothetical protein
VDPHPQHERRQIVTKRIGPPCYRDCTQDGLVADARMIRSASGCITTPYRGGIQCNSSLKFRKVPRVKLSADVDKSFYSPTLNSYLCAASEASAPLGMIDDR